VEGMVDPGGHSGRMKLEGESAGNVVC